VDFKTSHLTPKDPFSIIHFQFSILSIRDADKKNNARSKPQPVPHSFFRYCTPNPEGGDTSLPSTSREVNSPMGYQYLLPTPAIPPGYYPPLNNSPPRKKKLAASSTPTT